MSLPSRDFGKTLRRGAVRARRYLAAVRYLPLAISLLIALALAPALSRSLANGGHVRQNYRGTMLPCPFGLLILAAGFLSLAPVALLARWVDDVPLIPVYTVALIAGVGVLGLADDAYSGESRGWRGHGAAVLRGGFSTGALKAAGTVALAI